MSFCNQMPKALWRYPKWVRCLAKVRPPLCVAHVHCDLEENKRRITSHDRNRERKLVDPDVAVRNHSEAKPLYGKDVERLLKLDTTDLSVAEAASAIADWVDLWSPHGRSATR